MAPVIARYGAIPGVSGVCDIATATIQIVRALDTPEKRSGARIPPSGTAIVAATADDLQRFQWDPEPSHERE